MSRRWKTSRCMIAAATLLLGAVVVGTASSSSAAAADPSTKYLGIFRESSPTDVPAGTAGRYGVTPASVQWFDSWATGNAFNSAAARTLWSQGIVPHFTWEPWNTALSVSDPNQIHLQDIVGGRWDSYIRARGAEFAAVGGPLMVRWGHEFNGNWYPWGIVNNNSDPSLYVRAYRHVHDLVVAAGATNVQWIWCFNNGSTPDAPYNDPARSYPGDGYVDWVAIDGYNWGVAPSWDPAGNYWTSFDTMFAGAYQKARAIAPRRPVMIAETASSEDGGNKAQWISDTSASLQSGRYPDLKSVLYFDQDKEERWSGTSSSTAQAAFRTWVNQPFMRGTGTDMAQVAAQYREGTPPTSEPPASQPPTSAPPPSEPPAPEPPAGACSATYRTVNSWSGGFEGQVTVTAGPAAISGWTARWALPGGHRIGQVWNGTLVAGESTAAVRNVGWNGSLGPRGSTTFGFIATGSPSAPAVACTSP
ncbi:cellulose binding domain-containing protein [Jidongwangia harbinensis]|uniref:cellulose binding domain-containing protein n=1 Tax=Jidongwangia harbinensis TaxID=2878561 RepID=UPI001CD9BCDA|nr:cellulose binding domain-containing protein [Jidongwangia harbinensis]MCA2211800.1 cellulose binding domain-containing protein [Jidongwangia harbinensis]